MSDELTAAKQLLISSQGRLSVVVESENRLRRLLAQAPNNPDVIAYLALSLDTQGRWVEAMPLYEKALSIDPQHHLSRERHEAGIEELNLFDLRGDSLKTRLSYSRFPERISDLQTDLEKAVRDHVLSHTPRDAISLSRRSQVVTIGSCFASNLAHALSAQNLRVTNLSIGEAINSTYANLEFVKWAMGFGPPPNAPRKFAHPEELCALFAAADVAIYTLGVAPCFFEKETGRFVLGSKSEVIRSVARGKYVFRNTTVQENVENLAEIVGLIRSNNPNCQFVFSLSPVPLMTTLGERSSVEADCLSKATLRIAADQIVSTTPGSLYWPAFEIVRWLGAYVPSMYGAEDGSPHHVSEAVVAMIMRLFTEFYVRP